jgi:hypothetical protein
MRLLPTLIGLAILGQANTPARAEDERPPLTVFFADGASQPLRAWSLSWEYAAWPKGESPARGTVSQKSSTDLLVGKKVIPTAGLTLLVEYQGDMARGLRAQGKDGKSSALKLDPPAAELLSPHLGKDVSVQVRMLDLAGETLTGGKRSLCVLAYTALASCQAEPAQRIVKIQFP